MKTVDMMDRIVDFSNQDDLADRREILLYYLNAAKLSIQRRFRFRYNQSTVSINLIPEIREYDVPSDYLRTTILRRPRPTRDVNNDAQSQFFRKYTDKNKFEFDYPAEDESGNVSTGMANAYIIYGQQILIGNTPNQAEVLKFDYDRKMPDYDEAGVTEDAFSIFTFDALIAGALEEIFSTWVYNFEKQKLWATKKTQRETELTVLHVSEEVSNMQRGLEVFG